jgi:DNA-binding phage protein
LDGPGLVLALCGPPAARGPSEAYLLCYAWHMAKTGFDRYFAERAKDRQFAAEYQIARAEIDSVDGLMRALEAARRSEGLSKAELARRSGTRPEAVRRLFTMEAANPTISTVVGLAQSMGYSLALVPKARRAPPKRRKKAA